MTDAVLSYTDEDTGTVFRWHGGAYIDVGYFRPMWETGNGEQMGRDDFHAHDAINVWNVGGSDGYPEWSDLEIAAGAGDPSDRGTPRPFRKVLELFEDRCREYLASDAEDGSASLYAVLGAGFVLAVIYLAAHLATWAVRFAETVGGAR